MVDSYGEVLHEEEIAITNDQLSAFENGLKTYLVKPVKEKPSKGCTGGTTNHFEARFSGGFTIKGYEYKCGGKSYGTLKGDTYGVKKYFQQMIPGFTEKMQKIN